MMRYKRIMFVMFVCLIFSSLVHDILNRWAGILNITLNKQQRDSARSFLVTYIQVGRLVCTRQDLRRPWAAGNLKSYWHTRRSNGDVVGKDGFLSAFFVMQYTNKIFMILFTGGG